MPTNPIDLSQLATDALATERIASHLEGRASDARPLWGEAFAAVGSGKSPMPSPPPVPAPAR